jgi:hypothetical protein
MHEIEMTCLERIAQDVVLANFDAPQLGLLQEANIPICRDDMTLCTHQFSEPPGDRAASGGHEQTSPTGANTKAFKPTQCERVEQLLEEPQAFSFRLMIRISGEVLLVGLHGVSVGLMAVALMRELRTLFGLRPSRPVLSSER